MGLLIETRYLYHVASTGLRLNSRLEKKPQATVRCIEILMTVLSMQRAVLQDYEAGFSGSYLVLLCGNDLSTAVY